MPLPGPVYLRAILFSHSVSLAPPWQTLAFTNASEAAVCCFSRCRFARFYRGALSPRPRVARFPHLAPFSARHAREFHSIHKIPQATILYSLVVGICQV